MWRHAVAALEREVPVTKALNPPCSGQLQQAGKTDSAGIEIPEFDTATTSSTSVHALLKKASFADQARKQPTHSYGISLSSGFAIDWAARAPHISPDISYE